MAASVREETARLAGRIWTNDDAAPHGAKRMRTAVESALLQRRVLALRYRDGGGTVTSRRVDPQLLAHTGGCWYLVAQGRALVPPRPHRARRPDRRARRGHPYGSHRGTTRDRETRPRRRHTLTPLDCGIVHLMQETCGHLQRCPLHDMPGSAGVTAGMANDLRRRPRRPGTGVLAPAPVGFDPIIDTTTLEGSAALPRALRANSRQAPSPDRWLHTSVPRAVRVS